MSQLVVSGARPGVTRFRMPGGPAARPLSYAPCVQGFQPEQAFPPRTPGVGLEGRARGTSWGVTVRCGVGSDLYGCGEHAGALRRNGKRVVCWNTDAYRYDDRTPSLYQSHPWVMGVTPSGSWFGVLVDTPVRVTIDMTGVDESGEFVFEFEGTPPEVYLLEADGPEGVTRLLTELTGRMQMPPRWALGYHQCRYSYKSAARVLEIARGFRERDIPCSVIWVDIDYMDGYRCFTFDRERFPLPSELNERLHALGFRSVWMIDPGIKADASYHVYASGREHDVFVKGADGEEFHGKVWPGACAFPDFLSARVREWWAGLYKEYLAEGMDGVWNDMNEPSVFDSPTKTMDERALHDADESLGGRAPHSVYHNAYGHFMIRATHEGVTRARPGLRPFVLTRAGRPGTQRYAATWTGDNTSNWDHLGWSVPMALNMGLSGQPFVGPDIGGYTGNADARLFMRWMGIGAFLPFARGHTEKGTRAHEPWSFGSTCERVCRAALKARERLMPYLYTCFFEASRTGVPVARPLFFADPADPSLRGVGDAFLLGPDLMVRVRTGDGPCGAPRLGGWRTIDLYGMASEDLPELLIREGSAIPLAGGPGAVDVVACPDGSEVARGRVYEDDGESMRYLQGEFCLAEIRCEGGRASLDVLEGRAHFAPRLGKVQLA